MTDKVKTFEFREGIVVRNKFPKLEIKIQENCDVKQLADALRAASEFVRKGHYADKDSGNKPT